MVDGVSDSTSPKVTARERLIVRLILLTQRVHDSANMFLSIWSTGGVRLVRPRVRTIGPCKTPGFRYCLKGKSRFPKMAFQERPTKHRTIRWYVDENVGLSVNSDVGSLAHSEGRAVSILRDNAPQSVPGTFQMVRRY